MTLLLLAVRVVVAAEPPTVEPATTKHQSYVEPIPGTELGIEMVAVPGGRFRLGSPEGEASRSPDEGPAVEVAVGPFWMAKLEITWDLYDAFRLTGKADSGKDEGTETALDADAVTRPTKRYGDESFGFGKGSRPVVGLTHHAAMEFARWLSGATGKTYRLPTEVEWEYACRAGTTSAYSVGDDPAGLERQSWYAENSDFLTQPVGTKASNPWGIHDMHGNVAEICLDHYETEAYARIEPGTMLPIVLPSERRYPHVVRGGSWDDDAPALRCAARAASTPDWSRRDPQQPKGIWWHTDSSWVGFRVVRAVEEDERLRGLRSKITRASP